MGKTYTPVKFFSDEIKVNVHSATRQEHLGIISIRDFANGNPVRLDQCEDTGEYLMWVGRMGDPDYYFAVGPESYE